MTPEPECVVEAEVTGDPGPGFPPYRFVWPRPGAERQGEDPADGRPAARAFASSPGVQRSIAGLKLRTRVVTRSPWLEEEL